MALLRDKEVRFDEYCKKCEYRNLPESEDPCDICLENPSNEWSHKPVYFKETEKTKDLLRNRSKSYPHSRVAKAGKKNQR